MGEKYFAKLEMIWGVGEIWRVGAKNYTTTYNIWVNVIYIPLLRNIKGGGFSVSYRGWLLPAPITFQNCTLIFLQYNVHRKFTVYTPD